MNQSYLSKARASIKYGHLKNQKPLLIILMGLPGTGKSYLANHLNEKYSFAILSGENITHSIFGSGKHSQLQYAEAYEILRFLVTELLEQSYNVVIDGTNLKYLFRKQIYESIGSLSKPVLIYLSADDTTALKRANLRGEDYSNPENILSKCSPETFAAFKTQLEPPRENETCYKIDSDEKLFEKVDTIVAEMIKSNI